MSLTKVGGVLSASLNGLNYPVTTVEYLVVAGVEAVVNMVAVVVRAVY